MFGGHIGEGELLPRLHSGAAGDKLMNTQMGQPSGLKPGDVKHHLHNQAVAQGKPQRTDPHAAA